MKRYIQLLAMMLLPVLLLPACKKNEHNIGEVLDKSGVKYQVVQDLKADPGGNTVILKNLTPGTLPMWDFVIGTSTKMIDTVKFAFSGEYVIRFSVSTGGRVLQLDSVLVKVTKDNLNYVNDPLWTAISGGVGQEKEWLLDTDGKFFNGPLYFYGLNNGWLKEGKPFGESAGGCYGTDCWVWEAGVSDAYGGKDVMMTKGDYGSMIFSLKGLAIFKATKPMEEEKSQSGTYMLNLGTKMLTINSASILRGYKPGLNGIKGISDWTNYRILSLDGNTMQLGVIRDKDVGGEGPAMLVYNFISRDFANNYVPPVTGPDVGFDPTFKSGELLSMLTGTTSGRLWKIDAEGNPIDWIGKGKGWTKTHADSRPWGWNETWDLVAKDSWILFNRVGGQKYTRNQNGLVTNGTFTINEATNEVSLSADLLIQNPGSSMTPLKNTFKVVKAFPGKVESLGIWFGTSYDPGKDEWFAFHYIL